MLWITKYRHNKLMENATKTIDDLREALWRKEKFEEICEKLTDKTLVNDNYITGLDGCISGSELILPDDVPRYVDDYFGGKVLKQEATPVTILDSKGKATYGLTAKKAEKGKRYILHINPNE